MELWIVLLSCIVLLLICIVSCSINCLLAYARNGPIRVNDPVKSVNDPVKSAETAERSELQF